VREHGARARVSEICDKAVRGVQNLRSNRHSEQHILAIGTVAVRALAVLSAACSKRSLAAERR
jgi:hypothetical protein